MFSLSATVDNGTLDIWIYDDNGLPDDPSAWTDLLEGASTVVVEFARSDGNDPPGPQGQWGAFTVNLLRPQGYVKRVLRRSMNGIVRNREFVVRFSIDGGPWYGPISILWSD